MFLFWLASKHIKSWKIQKFYFIAEKVPYDEIIDFSINMKYQVVTSLSEHHIGLNLKKFKSVWASLS